MKIARFAVLTLAFFCGLAATSSEKAEAVIYQVDLMGRGYQGTLDGYGMYGLYLAPDFKSRWLHKSYFNFSFVDATLNITDSGKAWVEGKLRHLYGGDMWAVDIQLDGFLFSDPSYFSSDKPYDGMFYDLANHPEKREGLEWESLDMLLTPLEENPDFKGPREWEGLSMPGIGHPNEAELHRGYKYRPFEFDAWYRSKTTHWGKYWVGDTKAFGKNPRSNPEIPEPATSAMLVVGLAGAGFISRLRKKK